MKWAGRLDMYRKIPAELMEGTKRGSALSLIAAAVMGILFLMETGAYFSRTTVTQLQLDTNDETRVRLNFNITMMDLKCDFAVVDVMR
jgi:Endoplasmic Reticulum-Golgi Intermediate Compartment (ERGIC)